jgi:hypothetical protein
MPGPATGPRTSSAASSSGPKAPSAPCPQLTRLLHTHVHAQGTAPDGRLFRSPRGGILHESSYGRTWHAAVLGPELAATALARRPYDLRHAALSLWLASGAPPAEIAARAGHSTHVLLSVYAHCIPGHSQITDQATERALALPGPAAGHPEHHRAIARRMARNWPTKAVTTSPGPVRQASAHSYPQ